MSNEARSDQSDERSDRSSWAGGLDVDQIRNAVKGIRYGEVRVIIQDGKIVQIERVEKQRLR